MKTCFKCGVERPLTDFYRHPQMGDGHLNKCKECAKTDVMRHREANLDKVRSYDRDRYRSTPYRNAQLRELSKTIRPANRVLSNAIRGGKVKKAEACWHCGSSDRIEGHHADYDAPLDVVWLCCSCHRKVHRQHSLLSSA